MKKTSVPEKPDAERAVPTKKPYHRPQLEAYGSVTQLTQSGTNRSGEGNSGKGPLP